MVSVQLTKAQGKRLLGFFRQLVVLCLINAFFAVWIMPLSSLYTVSLYLYEHTTAATETNLNKASFGLNNEPAAYTTSLF